MSYSFPLPRPELLTYLQSHSVWHHAVQDIAEDNEIIGMLHKYEVYNLYENKLRVAAYNAMKKDRGYIGFINLND